MPREARMVMDNACYHIITRGNNRVPIFKDESDYEKYLKLVKKYKERFDFKLYGWCLMNNHVHMVLESGRISAVMHGLNLSYAQYFRYKYKGVGHFWQDRFKSHVIQRDCYLINCITYIEYNPVRAEIVSRPEDYRWSSYNCRILGNENDKGLLDTFVL
jgi:putative transposase